MRFKRYIGLILYYGIARYMPRSSSLFKIGKYLRRFCARLILTKCGKNVNVEKGASFSSKCTLGDNSGIGLNADIYVAFIGRNVMMGPSCRIISQNHNFSRKDIPMTQQGNGDVKPVIICDDVWIGANVIILPGVEIGQGSIIGAGSVVTKNVPPFSICCGNPAVVKRKR